MGFHRFLILLAAEPFKSFSHLLDFFLFRSRVLAEEESTLGAEFFQMASSIYSLMNRSGALVIWIPTTRDIYDGRDPSSLDDFTVVMYLNSKT